MVTRLRSPVRMESPRQTSWFNCGRHEPAGRPGLVLDRSIDAEHSRAGGGTLRLRGRWQGAPEEPYRWHSRELLLVELHGEGTKQYHVPMAGSQETSAALASAAEGDGRATSLVGLYLDNWATD